MSDPTVAGRKALLALALAAGQLCCAPSAKPISRSLPVITGSVDEAQLVKLSGNVRPEALNPAYDLGRVDDSFVAEHMLLQLQRAPQVEQAFEQLIERQTKPGSPDFHNWLTPAQIGEQFGPADEDVDQVAHWLTSHGLQLNNISPARNVIDFSGTAAQLRETFHTELHALNVKGERHVANVSDPQIPAALAPVIVGVMSMHDFRPQSHVARRSHPDYNAGSGLNLVVPEDLATIYNLNPLFDAGVTGEGVTLAVLEDTDVFSPPVDAGPGVTPTDDWNTFRRTFGLSGYTAGTFTQIHPPPASGPNNCLPPGVDTSGAASEAILDAEWASASAPAATIELVACANTMTFGVMIALQNVVNSNATPPSVVSISYGGCEAGNGAADNAGVKAIYQQATAEGISIFVSTGDSGAAGCDSGGENAATGGIAVSGLSSTPYNVAVGGTDFADTYQRKTSTYWAAQNTANFGSALSYIPEIPWNGSCASELLTSYHSFQSPVGTTGYCNSGGGKQLEIGAGGGGQSGCATGVPDIAGVVSGGCLGYAKPAWQSVLGNPNDGVRDVPDVALFASSGDWNHYLVYCDSENPQQNCSGAPSTWPGAGGTSFASPIMAGIQALVDQKWGGRQGNPNPIYYQIAAAEYGTTGNSGCNATNGNAIDPSCSFNDVTLGDIDVACTGPFSCYMPGGTEGALSTSLEGYAPAFSAHTGWDFATGIGSVNAANLVNNTAWGDGQTNLSWTPPHP